jgi:hypothetical protein
LGTTKAFVKRRLAAMIDLSLSHGCNRQMRVIGRRQIEHPTIRLAGLAASAAIASCPVQTKLATVSGGTSFSTGEHSCLAYGLFSPGRRQATP